MIKSQKKSINGSLPHLLWLIARDAEGLESVK